MTFATIHSGRAQGAALAWLLLALGCAPQGGHSDDCGATSWGTQPVSLLITRLDGSAVPPSSLDLTLARRPGEAVSARLEFSVQTHADWCGSSYSGALTCALSGLPAGASASFEPATLAAAVAYAPRTATVTLDFPATVPDGPCPLRFAAAEGPVDARAYRLVLTSRP